MALPPMFSCYVCNQEATEQPGHNSYVKCARCGEYLITSRLRLSPPRDRPDAYILSGVLRHSFDAEKTLTIGTENIDSLIKNAPNPRDPLASIDEILKLAFDRTKEFGGAASINQSRDYPLAYAKSSDEFGKFVFAAEKLGYIEITPGKLAILTLKGWERVGDIRKNGNVKIRVAFMAMRFNDPKLDEIYLNYLQPAIAQTGFELKRVDEGQPAGLIDDQLRVRIRNSKFLLAQLAAHNNGVYWEAGYADGLGKPVIYLCNEAEERPHFDTNHFTTVYWNENELDKAMVKLKATVRATFPADAKMEDNDRN